jgi:beta-lactamase class A
MRRLAMWPRTWGTCLFLLLPGLLTSQTARSADWRDDLRQRINRIDSTSPGTLGVYVKRLDSGETVGHNADQIFYLSSSTKVPIALAVLQQVDAGKLTLQTQVKLLEADKIDGSGEVVWNDNGTSYSLDSLLTRMLGVSDNTAANMLIRTVGEDALNQSAAAVLGKGFEKLTTLKEVRLDVYAEFHPDARKLTSRQLLQIAAAKQGPQRVETLRRALGVPRSALKVKTMDEAYDRYYRRNFNSATLEGYGGMLEQLVRGKLLSAKSQEALFGYMKFGRRGDYRLEGGIPRKEMIIHKTGTQYRRACHMAVINPQQSGTQGIVVTTCAKDMDDQNEAGKIFRRVGDAVAKTALVDLKRLSGETAASTASTLKR